MRFPNAKHYTHYLYKIDLGLMHAYIRLLSSRESPEYRLTELFKQFQFLPTLQMSIIQSSYVYPSYRRPVSSSSKKSTLENVFSLVTVSLKYED